MLAELRQGRIERFALIWGMEILSTGLLCISGSMVLLIGLEDYSSIRRRHSQDMNQRGWSSQRDQVALAPASCSTVSR